MFHVSQQQSLAFRPRRTARHAVPEVLLHYYTAVVVAGAGAVSVAVADVVDGVVL